MVIELIGHALFLLALGAGARAFGQQVWYVVTRLAEFRRKQMADVVTISRVESDTQRALVVRVEAPAHSRETAESLDQRAAKIYTAVEKELSEADDGA